MPDSHPIVRRRPRPPEQKVSAQPVQTYGAPVVLVLADDPALAEFTSGAELCVYRWVDHAHASAEGEFSGDLADPATYTRFGRFPDLAAVIALRDRQRCDRAAAAVGRALPAATVLSFCELAALFAAGPSSGIDIRAVLSAVIETELVRLSATKRVRALRAFAQGAEILPILVHPDPDPDALASALALRALLGRSAPETPIVTLDEMTRPENRRMAELLDIQVTQVTSEELQRFERILCTDMQPRGIDLTNASVAVIDHHPPEDGYPRQYVDIRPNYGATATILTEYLRAADGDDIGIRLATALTYAIKSDTDGLSRGVHPADVDAYTFLFEKADAPLLRRIERRAYSVETFRAIGRVLANIRVQGDLAVAFLGSLDDDAAYVLAGVADFALTIEEVTWSAVAGLIEDSVVITLRHLGGRPGAGDLAKALAAEGGAGGGHVTMARAVLKLDENWGALRDAPHAQAQDFVLERIRTTLEQLR